MLVGGGAIDDLALIIPHLDLRAGKRLFARDALLGERDVCVNQLVMHGFGQTDTNDIGILHFGGGVERYGEGIGIELPAVRRGQLLDVILAMGITTREG